MNRKKIASLLLACLVISSSMPKTTVFADTNSNISVINNIILNNGEALSFSSLQNKSVSSYIVSADNASNSSNIITEIKNSSQLSPYVDIINAKDTSIRINLIDTKASLVDVIKTLNHVTAVAKDINYIPNIADTSSNDFDTQFYNYVNSKYIKTSALNGNAIVPTIALTSATLSNAKYLTYKITTVDNASKQTISYNTCSNLSAGTYSLPEINSSNIKQLIVEYNLLDASGNVLKKAKQTISEDSAKPVLTIENAAFNLNSSGLITAKLSIKATGENSEVLLKNPIIYLNDDEVSSASTSFDPSKNIYNVCLNIPSSAGKWNIKFFASDDALSLGSVSLNSDSLLKFDNFNNNTVTGNSDSTVTGTLPSSALANTLKINNSNAVLKGSNFIYENANKSSTLTSTYTYSTIPVSYTLSYTEASAVKTSASTFSTNTAKNSNTASIKTSPISSRSATFSTNKPKTGIKSKSLLAASAPILTNAAVATNANESVNIYNDVTITPEDNAVNTNYYSNNANVTLDVSSLNSDFISGSITVLKDNLNFLNEALSPNSTKQIFCSGDGYYSIKVSYEDSLGNSHNKEYSFTIDTKAPTATFDNVTEGAYYSSFLNPDLDVNEDNLDTNNSYFQVTLPDGSIKRYNLNDSSYVTSNKLSDTECKYTLSKAINSDGHLVVNAYLVDLAGNATSLQTNYNEETSDLTPKIIGVTNGGNSTASVTPTIEIDDAFLSENDIGPGKAINATLNGVPYTLHFKSKTGNKLLLTGDTISGITPKGQQNTLTVSASGLVNPASPKVSTTIFELDTEAPAVSIENGKDNTPIINGKFYSGEVDPIIKVSDNYAVENYAVCINGTSYTGTKNADGSFTIDTAPIKQDGAYNIYVSATDEAGNIETSSESFTLDNSAPIINISGVSNGEYTNNTVNPSIQISDTDLDTSSVVFTLKKDGNEIPCDVKNNNGTYTFPISDEGNYSFTVTAKDEAGNVSTSSPTSFTIDKTSPTGSFDNVTQGAYYNTFINPEIDAKESNLDVKNSYFQVTAPDGSIKKYAFNDSNYVIKNSLNNAEATYTLSNAINTDGNYSVEGYLVDLAGNISKIETNYNEETSDVTPIITGVSNGGNAKNSVTPIVEVDDSFLNADDIGPDKAINATLNGSPYTLHFTSKNGNKLILTGDPITGNTARGENNLLVVSAKSKAAPTDEKTSSVSFNLDDEPPVISISNGDNENLVDGNFYTGEIGPIIHISDNYKVENYSVTINGENYTGIRDADGNVTVSGAPITEDGSYSISVTAADSSGNAVTLDKSFTLDNTAPSVKIQGVSNGEYTNKDVNPYIEISDTNLDSSSISFNLKKDGESIPANITYNNGRYEFSETEEGTYSITASARDKAGNITTTGPVTFTIDKTAPVLKFNFKDGSYINKFFTPLITTENPDDHVSKVLINGIAYDPQNIPELISDGVYTIVAQGEDKAGNISNVYTSTFTIDTTAPTLNIQNLISNFYYNRDVSPNISSSDINPSSFSMTLNGMPYNNEPITAEGSYELVITSIDKAGNVSRQVIDFVIDKTAPIITIKGVINNETLRSILTPLIGINDPNAIVTILLDGQDYHGGTISTDGKHTLVIEAVDRAGNISKKIITFFLKATPPSINVSNLKDGSTYTSSVTPDISFSSDIVPDDTVMTLDGKAYKLGDEISGAGNHVLYISVEDSAGNITTKTIKFTIESTSIIPATIPKIIKNILPNKITKSKSNMYIFLASTSAIAIGIVGIALYKLKFSTSKLIRKKNKTENK